MRTSMRRFSLRFNGVIACVLVYEDEYEEV
jgi:hypothetical protein